MKKHLLSLPLLLLSAQAQTEISVATPGPWHLRFKVQAIQAMTALESSPDEPIRRLHSAVVDSPMPILIHPITKDRATWHEDGDRSRAHTEPALWRKNGRGEARDRPVGSIVYLPAEAVDPRSSLWRNGVLVHELVHAMDLAYGRYHSDYRIRERRAVALQNIWRARHGHPLRTTYHRRFPTRDYQDALRGRTLERLMHHLFQRADLPPR